MCHETIQNSKASSKSSIETSLFIRVVSVRKKDMIRLPNNANHIHKCRTYFYENMNGMGEITRSNFVSHSSSFAFLNLLISLVPKMSVFNSALLALLLLPLLECASIPNATMEEGECLNTFYIFTLF